MKDLTPLLFLLLFAGATYFLIIRPARKRAHDVNTLQSSLAVGSRVMLNGGIFGTVVTLTDTQATLEVAPGVVIDVHRGGIGKIVVDEPSEAQPQPTEPDSSRTAPADGDDNRGDS